MSSINYICLWNFYNKTLYIESILDKLHFSLIIKNICNFQSLLLWSLHSPIRKYHSCPDEKTCLASLLHKDYLCALDYMWNLFTSLTSLLLFKIYVALLLILWCLWLRIFLHNLRILPANRALKVYTYEEILWLRKAPIFLSSYGIPPVSFHSSISFEI